MKEVTLKSLKLDDDIDGISFSIDKKDPDNVQWNFSMMKLSDKEKQEFYLTDMGYKYQIVFYTNNRAEVFEAVIGDINYYVKNLLYTNQEGIILKKCAKSEEILNKIFRGKFMQALTVGLVELAEKKAEAI